MQNIESKIKENVSLKNFSTFKIGGEAELFLEIKEKEDLIDAFNFAHENSTKCPEGKKIHILGGGSNTLINDGLIEGLVLVFKNDSLGVKGERIEVQAGTKLGRALHLSVSNNLSGLEWSAGIPGATLGGAIRGNAEAFGNSIGVLVETVEAFDIDKKQFLTLSNRNCLFSYRHSLFKEKNNLIIWGAVLKLRKEKSELVKNLMEEAVLFRTKKYPKLPSIGSIFKNVALKEVEENNPLLFNEIKDKIDNRLGNVGAGLLIDMAGLKGKTIGGAKISLEHANHIVNTGKATAKDVITLISLIKQKIRNNFKIQLREEIYYLGF